MEDIDDTHEYGSDVFRDDEMVRLPQAASSASDRRRASSMRIDDAYAAWAADRTPENMTKLLDTFSNTINSEITRFEGSRPLLRSRARALAVRAVKTYNPASGAKLQSWVVTNLQPLARYGQRQRDVRSPEVALRQAAEIDRVTRELRDDLGRTPTDDEIADEIGISPKRVAYARSRAVASVSSGALDEVTMSNGDEGSVAPGVSQTDPVPFATEAVYMSLSPEDRSIFDAVTGSHGARQVPASAVAARLGMSPSSVSARASRIAGMIAEVADAWN